MPQYDPATTDLLRQVQAMSPKDRRPAEIDVLFWPSGTKTYACAQYDELPGYENLSAKLVAVLGTDGSIICRRVYEKTAPFLSLPRTASIGDDSVDLEFDDKDDAFSDLLLLHREGVRVEIFIYYPAVNLLLSEWRGALRAPKSMTRDRVKVSAGVGFKSRDLTMPNGTHATTCLYVYGGLLRSQAEIDYYEGCPYNAHVGGSIGVPGLASCSRRDRQVCFDHLNTYRYWPGYEVRPDPVQNNQTKGPNLLAFAQGNVSELSDKIRVIIGERVVNNLPKLAYRNETNTNHPDKGFGAALFEVGEGPMQALWNFYMNGVYVAAMHSNFRLGELGQPPTGFSPSVNSYSGRAVAFGRVQGNFNNNQAAQLSGSIRAQGLRNIRVYSDESTFTETYSINRLWGLLKCLTNPRWGYGNPYTRYGIASAIDTASWCDENVTMRAPDGTTFSGPRSTLNVEMTGRPTQQQITDICTAGRIGLPFDFGGKDVFVPLREEAIDDSTIPTFADGFGGNIVYESARSTLEWSQQSDTELINQWTVNFDDASNGFVDTQLVFGDQAQQLAAGRAYGDSGVRIVNKTQAAYGITNFPEAARFGVFLLYLGPLDTGGISNNWEIKFTTWYSEALFVQTYKPVRVLNTKLQSRLLRYYQQLASENPFVASYFANLAYEYFRVKKVTRKGDLKVEITAQVYPKDFMAYIETTVPPDIIGPVVQNPGGRRNEQPEPIGLIGLAHSGDRITGRFAASVY